MGQHHQVHTQVPATATVTKLLYNAAGRIVWHSFKETTGSASAEYVLYDGSGTSGPIVMDVTLSSGQSTRDSFLPHGLEFHNGLYVAVASGTVLGVVTIVPEEYWDDFAQPKVVINIPIDELAQLTAAP